MLRRGPCGGRLGRSGAGRGCHVGVHGVSSRAGHRMWVIAARRAHRAVR
ncbi:hypothetical protein HMPREF0682_1681 [Propionibacterium acidifaciens F0233]|uniref:Uncharacterized protein n=1 Tax=Propionibacterium acidifaciens F0233 TaxID=553198 RepID=U2QGT8_9ACTN|nr:hypothetical protein HMPREF0682_1681 [Propionibacterium acidifaciens F0233]